MSAAPLHRLDELDTAERKAFRAYLLLHGYSPSTARLYCSRGSYILSAAGKIVSGGTAPLDEAAPLALSWRDPQQAGSFAAGYRRLQEWLASIDALLGPPLPATAAKALKVAMPGTEEEANIHHLVGTVYQQQRKFDEAIAEFQAALGIVPGMSDALFSLGWTYALQGNDEEAKRYLDKYVMMAGADAPEHYVKAARDRLAELRTESP